MLISETYRKQNQLLHQSPLKFGHRGHKHIPQIRKLMEIYECVDVLDYGSGKADLQKQADFPVVSYDPAIPEYCEDPEACDLVVCTDVLEHIEPEYLDNVLRHIQSKMLKAGYFVINTGPDKSKTLPDGSNPHKIIEGGAWWLQKLTEHFTIDEFYQRGCHVYGVVR